jgi:hypothetical protein
MWLYWGCEISVSTPRRWVDDSITRERMAREGKWSEAIAVGNRNLVEKVKSKLGSKAAHREVNEGGWHRCAPGAK